MSAVGDPVWALATRFPSQGDWSEADFFGLPDSVRHVELATRLLEGCIREPDVVFLRKANAAKKGDAYWAGADLVVEIVSGGPEDRVRDHVTKRAEYADAGIAEYWIVDPTDDTFIVLSLDGATYREVGVFRRGERASSVLLDGLEVDVTAVLDAD